MAENEMDPAELVEKALLVQNLGSLGTAFQSDSALQDKLTIHFQKKSNRGGDVQNVIYPLNSLKEDAIVIFADAKDMMSAARHEHVFKSQHEPMCRSHPITVRRLPPVFASVEAKIDPLYFNIMPLGGASAGFSKRIEKLANVEVDRTHAGKISCSHLSQLELVEREVCGLVMRHAKYYVSSEDDGFEAAGASNLELHSKPVHMGLGEHDCREEDEMEVAEEIEGRRTTGSFSKQSDEPEDFLGDHSTTQMQPASTKECDDKSKKKQSSLPALINETCKETDIDNVRRIKNEDNLVVLDKSTYAYLQKFEGEAFTKLTKRNMVQVKVVQGYASEELEGFIIPSSKKTSALNVSKAKDEFISFYQKLYYEIERKMVDCSSVDAPSIDKATTETIRQFKDDTFITKVDGYPHLRLILRRGNVEEVVRQFRKIAGIKSRKTLRNAGAGVHGTEDTRSDITNSTRFGADNPEDRSKDGQHNKQPNHNPRLVSGSFNDDMEFTTNEGMHITIRTGDITKQSAIAVVCPSDQYLGGNDGVAKAILDAAGAQLRGHCRQIMRGRNPLQMTECVVTPGFSLRYSVVIHVWGPTNPYHQQQFKSDLYCSFLNCLRIAERETVSSLAIPLMGSGSIGAPKMLCADALAYALIHFSRESGGSKYVREVFLVNIDNDSNKDIQLSLQMAFNAQHHPVSPSYSSSSATSGMDFPQFPVGDPKKPGAVSHIQPTTPISPSNERSKHGKSQAPVKTDYHGIEKAPESQHHWRKQGESQGHVKNDQHGFGEKHSKQNVKADEWPTPEESEEQLKKILKDATVGNAADREAYRNRTVRHDADPADKPVRSTGDQGGPLDAKPQAQSADVKEARCPICLADKIVDAVVLSCKHQFCKACIDQALKSSYKCPICQAVCDKPRGNQPKGTMKYTVNNFLHISGYGKDGVITIDYCIPSGTQSADNPNPGKNFTGTSRTAYLPDNREGREVLDLLRKAFDAGLVFTVGQSITSGQRDAVTWNDIHHKTSMYGGPQNYGYPDPDYLKRVKEDLAAKGIK